MLRQTPGFLFPHKTSDNTPVVVGWKKAQKKRKLHSSLLNAKLRISFPSTTSYLDWGLSHVPDSSADAKRKENLLKMINGFLMVINGKALCMFVAV